MRKILLTLMLLVLLPLAASAEVWKVDGVYYSVTSTSYENVAMVIKSPTGYSGNLDIKSHIFRPADVENRELYYGYAYVTCIDKDAFEGCSGLTSININLDFDHYLEETIPAGLFKDCYNLSRITLNNGKKGYCYSPDGSNAIIQGHRLIAGCKNTIIPSNVVVIGEEAFAGCRGLTELTIPNHVGKIGNRAFADCTNLKSVNIFGYNEGYQYFPDDYIHIGPSLTISSTAFEGCTSLTTVTVKSGGLMGDDIGSGFSECTALTEVIFEEGVEKIGKGAFAGCTGITSIRIPNSVKEVGAGAFEGCTGLTSVSIGGDGIKVAGAFGRCTALTDVIIEEGEKIIQNYENSGHFDGCSNLRSLIVRGTITTRSDFSGSIFTEASIPNIYYSDINGFLNSNQGFGSSYERYHMFLSGDALENPEDVTDQKRSYFVYRIENEGRNKGKFVSYGLKDNYTTIPINVDASLVSAGILNINAFKAWRQEYQNAKFILENGKYKCGWAVEVEHLKIPEGVTTIPDGAFWGCASLKSVTFPSSLTSIGETAFSFCDSLLLVLSPIEEPFAFKTDYSKSILYYSSLTAPPENVDYFYIGSRKGPVYYRIKKDLLTLYVPKGSVSDYKNTNDWSKFPNIESYDPDNPPTDLDIFYPGHHHENVTITANSYTINYGDEFPEFEYTTTGAALQGTPEISCEATKTSPVGTYPIVVSKGTITNTKTTFVNGTLTITKAPLTIKAGNYTKVEGEENPTFTLTYEGFKNNEKSAVLTKQPTVSCSATKDSPAGDYPVSVSGAEAQNYSISYVSGTLTVTANSGGDNPEDIITFADPNVKVICVANWDTSGDGEVSKGEAAAVTDIGTLFRSKRIKSFDEIRYFTGVTSLAEEAFYWNTSMKSFTIPAFITNIGAKVFAENCINALSVDTKNPVYDSRDNCNAIVETATNKMIAGCGSTVIPASVTAIGEGAFYGAFTLKTIDIPITVNSIGTEAFYDCRGLESVTVHRTTPYTIDDACFKWWDSYEGVYQKPIATLYVPTGSKSLYEQADGWKDFEKIVEMGGENPGNIITFADSNVKAICVANWDTDGDGELSKTEAAAVTSLGDGFKWLYNCTFDELQYFTGLTKLENGTFNGIILSLIIPVSVTEIEESALSGVREVKLSEGNTKFLLSENILYNIEKTELVFCSRSKEGTVAIPSTVRTIRSYAFNGCDKLEGVTLPEGLNSIDRDAFYGCSNIKELTLPSTLTEIGVNAFYDCHGLTAVYSMIMEPFSISHTVFERTIEFDDHSNTHYMPSSATLYVPLGKKEQYKSVPGFVYANDNGWTRFAQILEMGSDLELGDLSGDGEVNGTDLVVLVDVIMNETYTPEADLNHDNEVNGTDLVVLVDMIMNAEPSASRADISAVRGEQASVVSISAEMMQADGESRELVVSLRNSDMGVTMVQMDIQLPKGLTLDADDDAIDMADRTSWDTHQLYVSRRGSNTVRLMLASGRNALIEGTDGALLRLKLKADEGLEDSDILLGNILCTSPTLQEARPQSSTVRVYGNGTTGIRELMNTDGHGMWYNMNGQRVEMPGRGVYIRNGKKVIMK